MQTEEAKRARQREHVKNSYYRKQNMLKSLRQEVKDLELEYSRTLQLKQQQMQRREVAGALDSDEQRSHSDDLVEKYMQLSVKKQQLVQENKELELLATKFTKFHVKTQHLLDSEPEVTQEPPPPAVGTMQQGGPH